MGFFHILWASKSLQINCTSFVQMRWLLNHRIKRRKYRVRQKLEVYSRTEFKLCFTVTPFIDHTVKFNATQKTKTRNKIVAISLEISLLFLIFFLPVCNHSCHRNRRTSFSCLYESTVASSRLTFRHCLRRNVCH